MVSATGITMLSVLWNTHTVCGGKLCVVVYYGFNVVKLLCGAGHAQYVPGNGARATPPEVSWTGAAFLLLVLTALLLPLLLLLLAR